MSPRPPARGSVECCRAGEQAAAAASNNLRTCELRLGRVGRASANAMVRVQSLRKPNGISDEPLAISADQAYDGRP